MPDPGALDYGALTLRARTHSMRHVQQEINALVFWNCYDLPMQANIYQNPYSMRAFGHLSLPCSGDKRDVAETLICLCIWI